MTEPLAGAALDAAIAENEDLKAIRQALQAATSLYLQRKRRIFANPTPPSCSARALIAAQTLGHKAELENLYDLGETFIAQGRHETVSEITQQNNLISFYAARFKELEEKKSC